jgi:phosphoglycerate dehydrogenase-like enzyme
VHLVFCGTGWLEIVDAIRVRLAPGETISSRELGQSLAELVRDAHVILPSNAGLDASTLAAAPHVRLVQQPAAGTDGIDRDAARARGVPVCNVPGANAASVAETALFLMLALARRLPEARRAFRERTVGAPVGRELRGKTVGIIGLGRSGSALAEAARGLGMNVLGVRSGSTRAELDALLASADVVSLHCPLTDATRGLLDGAAFRRMKRGAFLVNCARGAIVDRTAVQEALSDGTLGGFGIDAHWQEPWDPDDPLYQRDDVVALPHVGGTTEEAFGRIADVVVENVRRVARSEAPLHRIA